MKKLLKNEISGWQPWEIAWMFCACSVIVGLSIYWGDTVMGIISATTGVACVVATGKGKLMAYVFGLVNCVLYAIISYQAQLYGETILNATYYLAMQFVGFFTWKKHMDSGTNEVEKKRMPWKMRIMLVLAMGTGTFLFGLFLQYIGDAMPYVDSFTTVASVFAMLISVMMFSEQWYIWVAVNVFSVYMWYCDFAAGSDNIATLIMWCVYLINSIIMLIRWESEASRRMKEAKNNAV